MSRTRSRPSLALDRGRGQVGEPLHEVPGVRSQRQQARWEMDWPMGKIVEKGTGMRICNMLDMRKCVAICEKSMCGTNRVVEIPIQKWVGF
jgi:hypothetical protein